MRVIPSPIACGTLLVAGVLCSGIAHTQGATWKIWPTRERLTSSLEDVASVTLTKFVAFGTTRSFFPDHALLLRFRADARLPAI